MSPDLTDSLSEAGPSIRLIENAILISDTIQISIVGSEASTLSVKHFPNTPAVAIYIPSYESLSIRKHFLTMRIKWCFLGGYSPIESYSLSLSPK